MDYYFHTNRAAEELGDLFNWDSFLRSTHIHMDAYRPLVQPYLLKYSLTVPISTGYSQGSTGGPLNAYAGVYSSINTETDDAIQNGSEDSGIYQQPNPNTQNGMILFNNFL